MTPSYRSGHFAITAFTLVEMLVCLGIIALLMSLILPTLAGARRAAQLTKCANNLRQIGAVMSLYLNESEQMLPAGRASDSEDDPGMNVLGLDGDVSVATATIGDQLDSYLRPDPRVWRCPSARVVRWSLGIRPAVVVENGLLRPAGSWRPGYMYVSTAAWIPFEKSKPAIWRHFWMKDWMGRNVAGLKVNRLNTLTLQPPSEIVLFLDYSSAFHSFKAVDDVYDVPQPFSNANGVSQSAVKREKFQSNFLYLDGHVDTKRYEWAGGLLNVLHKPIKQKWGGTDWTVKYSESYTDTFPD